MKMLIKKHYILFLLIIFVVAIRLPVLLDTSIPFIFDHGKDSLATLDMVVNLSPKFVGPWTSIPGLYFGPGWYYLLAPGFVLTMGHPASGVLTMILLLIIQIIIAYKYFGEIEALIISTGAIWYTVSMSAWNPFPMTLVSLLILTIISRLSKKEKLSEMKSFLLMFFSSLGFHFSTAFAIFFLPLIVLSLFYRRIKISIKSFSSGLVGFAIPFVPQLLFEIKNNFIQTKAILGYLKNGESQTFSIDKIKTILLTTYGELQLAVVPQIWTTNEALTSLLRISGLVLVGISVFFAIRKRKNILYPLWFETSTWLTLPLIAFFFLHFNLWYLLALMPVVALLVGHAMRHSPKSLQILFSILMVLTPISFVYQYYTVNRATFLKSERFLPIKLDIINEIRKQSEGRPFASYHYVPDIYDFSYQYIYFWQAHNGQKLPTEFSYKPNESIYIVQKQDLLAAYEDMQVNEEPEKIFYIVENPSNPEFLDSWWNHQNYGEIISEIKINEGITLFTATPDTSPPNLEDGQDDQM